MTEVFHRTNYTGVRAEGTAFARAVVNGEKITVYEKFLRKAEKSGVLYEHLSLTITYSAHTNAHGVKYLKVEEKSSNLKTKDTSLQLALSGTSLRYTGLLLSSEAYEVFLMETISSWFNLPASPEVLQDGFSLIFPALSFVQPDDKEGSLMKTLWTLERLSGRTTRVASSLREGHTFHEAARSLFGDTIQSGEDSELLKQYPKLMLVADMNLGMALSEFLRKTPSLIENMRHLGYFEMSSIKLMLNYLPEPKRETILGILADRSKSSLHQSKDGSPEGHIRLGKSPLNYAPLTPKVKHKELSEEMFEIFTLPLQGGTEHPANSSHPRTVQSCLRYWFAEHVLEPLVKSATSMQEVVSRFNELLMPECNDTILPDYGLGKGATGVNFDVDRRGTVFASVTYPRERHFSSSRDTTECDLIYGLYDLSRCKEDPLRIEYGNHYFIGANGTLNMIIGHVFSLEGFLAMVESGVREVDKRLIKLGREVTPANRKAYLAFGHKDRKFRNTWRYYDLGVTHARKVLTLKSLNVTSKRDIEMYAALPDEIFYELTEMESPQALTS